MLLETGTHPEGYFSVAKELSTLESAEKKWSRLRWINEQMDGTLPLSSQYVIGILHILFSGDGHLHGWCQWGGSGL